MNNSPLVSVITPMYNQKEEYLIKCLDSLRAQTLKEIEFIVVNDGSTNLESVKLCEKYAQEDKRFILVNQENGGMGRAYNAGIKIARGEYIGFLESDDWAEANMFETLYGKACKTGVDIVKSDFYFYREIPETSDEYFHNYNLEGYDCVINPFNDHEIFKKLPCLWTAIYRKKLLLDNKIFYNETPGASYQDTSFAFIVFAKAKSFYYLPQAFVHYRIDNEASSVKSKNKVYCICDEFQYIEKFLDKNPRLKDKLQHLKNYLKYFLFSWNLRRISWRFRWEFLMHFSQEFQQEFRNNLIVKDYFTPRQYRDLVFLTRHPIIYYFKRKLYKK